MIEQNDTSFFVPRPWLRRLVAFLAMLIVAWLWRPELLTDWDSWDYTVQAVGRQSSFLLLGRWWFVAAMHVTWLAGKHLLGLEPLQAYMAMQAANALMMAAALVVGMAWIRRLTRQTAAELVFAALVLTGPMFGLYATNVMTESMTLLALVGAWLLWEHAIAARSGDGSALALLAGLCFGVAIDIREPAALLCAWPILSCLTDRPRRWWALLTAAIVGTVVSLGVGVLGGLAWREGDFMAGIAQWTKWMADERGMFPVSIWGNMQVVAFFTFMASPVAAVLSLPAVAWAALFRRRMFWVAMGAVPYLGSLLMNHDMPVNPRFVLPLLLMLLPATSAGIVWLIGLLGQLGRRVVVPAAAAAVAAVITLAAIWPLADMFFLHSPKHLARIYTALETLPPDAVLVPGPGTPVAGYISQLGDKQFDVIASGWGWPGEKMPKIIDRAVREGRPVYVNIQEGGWARNGRPSGEVEMTLKLSENYRQRPVAWPMVQLLPDEPATP